MSSKPTVKEIEEYMASLNILDEQKLNGTTASDFNVISKPKHYMLFEDKGIEVRDVIEKLSYKAAYSDKCPDSFDNPLFVPDYVQLMQYLMRFMDKNGKEDLEKARWYLDKMISAY
jgi:hypothetical protein